MRYKLQAIVGNSVRVYYARQAEVMVKLAEVIASYPGTESKGITISRIDSGNAVERLMGRPQL